MLYLISEGEIMASDCSICAYNIYDEDLEEYVCSADMDEDDVMRFLTSRNNCPFFNLDDEYKIVRKQN